jgi:hypothetical protein
MRALFIATIGGENACVARAFFRSFRYNVEVMVLFRLPRNPEALSTNGKASRLETLTGCHVFFSS